LEAPRLVCFKILYIVVFYAFCVTCGAKLVVVIGRWVNASKTDAGSGDDMPVNAVTAV
jgi:hypothetical protein